MVHTFTVLTLQLAQAIGLYLFATGIGILRAPAHFARMVDEMERSPGLAHALGLVALAIGVAILIPHHVLYDPLGIAVTLIALLCAIEGLLLLAVPDVTIAIARPVIASLRPWAIRAIVFSLILFLRGFTGRANAFPKEIPDGRHPRAH